MSISQERVFGFSSIRNVPINICPKVKRYEDTDTLRLLKELLRINGLSVTSFRVWIRIPCGYYVHHRRNE